MWPFRKKPAELTLKTRVAEFWRWYAANAARFFSEIEDGHCSELQPEVSDAVDRWLPSMAWVFGVGENKIGHSFTLSGEGTLPKQFIAEYWNACAPKLDGWTFYASRQPSDNVRKFSLKLDGEHTFEPQELWLHLWIDDQSEKIDVTAWHPLYEKISDREKWTSLFLLFDEALGEHGSQNWIGEIKVADNALRESVPIWELPEFIDETAKSRGWKKHKPTDTYTSYSVKKQYEGFRGDVFVGTARYWSLIRDVMNAHVQVEHPCPKMGVDFVSVVFPSEILPKGQEVDFRATIEDEIIASFEKNRGGDTLGGATGTKNTYSDFIIYDSKESIQQIREILKRHGLPKETTIQYLTQDKANIVHRL